MTTFVPISGLTAATQVKSTDLYPGVDTTDMTQASTGTTKKYTIPLLTDYVTANILSQRLSCRVATTASLTVTYSNGSSGIGATLTNAGAQVALVIDGITLSVGDRVLVKDQSSQTQNGIYTVTDIGSGSSNWIMTRATDYDNHIANLVVEGTYTLIEEGSTNAGKSYYQTTAGTITIGVSNIIFAATGPNGGLTNFSYNLISGTSTTMNQNQGYVANNAGLVTLTLPTTAVFGSIIEVVGMGAGGWSIAQNVGQNIQILSTSSTAGVGGSVSSSLRYDSIKLLCITANTTWTMISGSTAGYTIV